MPSRHTDDIKRQNEEKGQDYLRFNKSSTKFDSADKRLTVGFFVIRDLITAELSSCQMPAEPYIGLAKTVLKIVII